METTYKSKMSQFFGVPSSEKMDTIIQDEFLRKALIDASIKMEEFLKEGKVTLKSRIVSKTEWGLEIDIEMSQPKEDKPIIFTYTHRINRVAFKQWIDEHAYMLGGPSMDFLDKRGLHVTIPGPGTDKYAKTFVSIVVKYDDAGDIHHRPNILESDLVLVVHREVVNNHDWIVKCVVD